jgi:hypothetical protein
VPPLQGLVLQDDSAYLRRRGIARDAVIVALDGFKVENLAQYSQIWAFDWRDQMSLGVFQGGKYESVAVDSRSPRVNLIAYKPAVGAKQ